MTHAEPPVVSDPNVSPAPVRPASDNSTGRAVREVIETLILAAVIFLGVRLVVLNFRVDGVSMVPNLHDQEMLLVNRNAYWHFDANGPFGWIPGLDRSGSEVYPFRPPERGDIVVFNPPVPDAERPYIKRVIGLPGEHVTFNNGSVLINGTPLDEPYLGQETRCGGRREHCDVVVPQGDVFVLGDNRGDSQDSRYFGPTTVDSIIGKAWVGYWPLDALGFVPHHDYPGISDQPIPATPGPSAFVLPPPAPPEPVRAGRRSRSRQGVGAGGNGPARRPVPRRSASRTPGLG